MYNSHQVESFFLHKQAVSFATKADETWQLSLITKL